MVSSLKERQPGRSDDVQPTDADRQRKRANRTRRIGSAAFVLLAIVGCGTADRPDGVQAGTTPPGLGPVAGPCPVDGAIRECHVPLGLSDGAAHCYVGTQECLRGAWTACGGSEVTIASAPVVASGVGSGGTGGTGGGGLHTNTLVTPSPTSPACADPCDPYCQGYDGTPNATPTGISVQVNVGSPFGNGPAGFVDKQNCDPCDAGYPKKCTGEDHYNLYDGCLADHHCDTVTKKCVFNAPALYTWPAATCSGVDLTVGAGCTDTVSGKLGFPICNRGDTEIPAGTVIDAEIVNPASLDLANCAALKPMPECTKTLAGPLRPGTCIRFTEDDCGGAWAGNRFAHAYIRGGAGVSRGECTFPGSVPACVNNWADVKSGDLCAAAGLALGTETVTYTFTPTCPPGTRVTWSKLGYRVQTPCILVPATGACVPGTRSSVRIDATSTDVPAPPGTGAVRGPDNVATSPNDPANCLASSGTPGCPKDLFAALGGLPGAEYPRLDVVVSLTANGVAPTLQSLEVTYRCVPRE